MKKPLAASDRKCLIRLASALPKGSGERKAVLARLKSARYDTVYTFEMLGLPKSPTNDDLRKARYRTLGEEEDFWYKSGILLRRNYDGIISRYSGQPGSIGAARKWVARDWNDPNIWLQVYR